jgi:hypothetical protein
MSAGPWRKYRCPAKTSDGIHFRGRIRSVRLHGAARIGQPHEGSWVGPDFFAHLIGGAESVLLIPRARS